MTFHPHPAWVLSGNRIPLICSLEERIRKIGETGIDLCLVQRFSRSFSLISAEDFVSRLHRDLHAEVIVVGHDTHFGHNRTGDYEFLRRMAGSLGIRTFQCAQVRRRGLVVSSSAVRDALERGDVPLARALLGGPFTLQGTVVRGDARGRLLGIPTANVRVDPSLLRPARGVYCCRARLRDRVFRAAVNLGVRPTFDSAPAEVIEAHLIGYDGPSFYGARLELEFERRLREERKFSSAEDLARQIRRDIARAACSHRRIGSARATPIGESPGEISRG